MNSKCTCSAPYCDGWCHLQKTETFLCVVGEAVPDPVLQEIYGCPDGRFEDFPDHPYAVTYSPSLRQDQLREEFGKPNVHLLVKASFPTRSEALRAKTALIEERYSRVIR